MHTSGYIAAQGSGTSAGGYSEEYANTKGSAPIGPLVHDATGSVRDAVVALNEMNKRATGMADALFGSIPIAGNPLSDGRAGVGIPQQTRSGDLRGALNDLHVAIAQLDATIARFTGI